MRVLLLYFSQSGDAAKVADALAASLQGPDVEIDRECVRPVQPYPYPWGNVFRFFNVMPESQLGPAPAIQPVDFDASREYDLVVLVYQVWFLAPSLPIQGFLASPAADVLKGRKVITVSVSRNMWQSASETMKRLLENKGAVHVDNIVVTHQGPPWATFVTAPRLLLFGKKEPFWGIFPAAGIGEPELERVRHLGGIIRERSHLLAQDGARPLLRGEGAVEVNRRYMIPELIGWYLFRGWAHVLRGLGKLGWPVRYFGIALFMIFLVTVIVVGIPVVVVLSGLLYPLVRKMSAAYADRLAQPSGPRWRLTPKEEAAGKDQEFVGT
jgi:hypothetical protein